MKSVTAETAGQGRWVGAPKGCRQHGRLWAMCVRVRVRMSVCVGVCCVCVLCVCACMGVCCACGVCEGGI